MLTLGERIKSYERVTDVRLTPNSCVFVRVDGRAFHTYLRGAERPFDPDVIEAMEYAMTQTAAEIAGFKAAYHQSDECTFLLTDFDNHETQGWFDYKLAKIVSITTSLYTGHFNNYVYEHGLRDAGHGGWTAPSRPACFDGRAFVVPLFDAPNVFIWRQRDWERNSVAMMAQSMFSPRQLHGRGIDQQRAMIAARGASWDDLPSRCKWGTFLWRGGDDRRKLTYDDIVTYAGLAPTEDTP